MDLLPTAEQEEIVTSVRAVLSARHVLGEPLDEALWDAACEQGWFTLGLDESLGGVGYGLVESVLLFRELGRAAVSGPFLATTLAAGLAARSGAGDLVTSIAGGSTRVALGEPHVAESWSVLDLPGAAVVLLIDHDGARLIEASSFAGTEVPGIDTLTPFSLGTPVGRPEPLAIASDLTRFTLEATLLSAALLAGIADAVTEQSVTYAKDRQQFGQPIGGFQAVKHRCADMATRAEVANTELLYAALAVADGRADGAFHAHSARVVAARAAIDNCEINIQNHGGIGFTWEHTAHRYLTRARVVASCCGTTTSHQAALLAEPSPR